MLFMLPNVGVGVFMFWGTGRERRALSPDWVTAARPREARHLGNQPPGASRLCLGDAVLLPAPPLVGFEENAGSLRPLEPRHVLRPCANAGAGDLRGQGIGQRAPVLHASPPPLFFQVVKPILAPRAAPAASRLLRSPCLPPGASGPLSHASRPASSSGSFLVRRDARVSYLSLTCFPRHLALLLSISIL